MRRKKNREINVFSASAIDLFASSMGVFIILVVVLFPYFGNISKTEPAPEQKTFKKELEQAQKTIKKQKQQVVEKEKEIEEQAKVVVEKDQKIEELEQEILKKEAKNSSLAKVEVQNSKKEQEIVDLKKKVDDLKSQIVQSDQKDVVQKLKDQEKASKKIIEELKAQNKDLKNNATQKAVSLQDNEVLKKALKEMKVKIEELKQKEKRSLASVDSNETLKKTIDKLKRKVSETTQKALQKEKQSQQLMEQLQVSKQKLQEEATKASNLKKQLEENTGKQDEKSFLAIVLKWSTYKHDIDLIVSSPQGKVYNYKRKIHSGYSGEFVLDSRSGPGAEVWQASELAPGDYTLTSNLYNNYGNEKPADVSASIFTKQGKVDVPKFSLSLQNRKKVIKFRVDKEGIVQFK